MQKQTQLSLKRYKLKSHERAISKWFIVSCASFWSWLLYCYSVSACFLRSSQFSARNRSEGHMRAYRFSFLKNSTRPVEHSLRMRRGHLELIRCSLLSDCGSWTLHQSWCDAESTGKGPAGCFAASIASWQRLISSVLWLNLLNSIVVSLILIETEGKPLERSVSLWTFALRHVLA